MGAEVIPVDDAKGGKALCSKCGSSNLSKSGKRWVAGSKKQQYLCGDCGYRTVNPVHNGDK